MYQISSYASDMFWIENVYTEYVILNCICPVQVSVGNHATIRAGLAHVARYNCGETVKMEAK